MKRKSNGLLDLGKVLCRQDLYEDYTNFNGKKKKRKVATGGRWYEVVGISNQIVLIQSDDQLLNWFGRSNFYTEQELRKEKLKRLNEKR